MHEGDAIISNLTSPAAGPAAATPPRAYYRPELDGLRFFAFLWVFLLHTTLLPLENYTGTLHLPPRLALLVRDFTLAGNYGVDLFFALSSFLITELLLREQESTGTLHLGFFYARRALRIWPLYFAALLIAFLLLPALGISTPIPDAYIAPFLLFSGNWACQFLGQPLISLNPLWSVSVEEQFYVFWPLLLRWLTPRRIPLLAGLLLLTGEITRILYARAGGFPPIFNTLARLDPIAWGALLAWFTHRRTFRLAPVPRGLLIIAAVAACTFTASAAFGGNPLPLSTAVIGYPLAALGCALLVGCAFHSTLLAVRPLVYLGRRSYGLYALHGIVLVLFAHFTPGAGALASGHGALLRMALIPLKLLVTIVLAAVSYRFLEQPFLRLKQRFEFIPTIPV